MLPVNELIEAMKEQGYKNLRYVPNKGVCGTYRFAFTAGLVYGMSEDCYAGRYCYHTWQEAVAALREWDGSGDPSGNWIKHKGYVEYSNPNYKENET